MLKVDNINLYYGAAQALRGVSLSAEPGKVTCVLGRNGVGKTSLLRAMVGQYPIASGSISFDGDDITTLKPYERARKGIGFVPQGREIFARLTVEENLRMGAFPRTARERYGERLNFVYGLFPRLEERRGQPAGTLSGGEQQMCAIGRALMSGPKLLLLDEPSAGLAPVVVQAIFDLVRRICAQGYTVLIVEQNIRQVLKVVGRAYLLEAGRIRLAGNSREFLDSEEIRKTYLGL